MKLNLSWIDDVLAVGGRYPMTAAAHMAGVLGIRHVVDLRVESCDDQQVLSEHGVELLHLPTEDMCAVSQDHLDGGVAWVLARIGAGERVYIHCEHGIGRSVLLALCVLVGRGHRPLEALRLIKDARERASPSPEQLEAWSVWMERRRIEVPGFDEMARIAYRHLYPHDEEDALQ